MAQRRFFGKSDQSMYAKATDLAKAALRFLDAADSLRTPQDEVAFSDHIFAAAILANHVHDWHTRDYGLKGQAAFRNRYPDNSEINDIANGVKHPFSGNVDISTGHVREVDWEDLEFWNAAHGIPTLFVKGRSGHDRSVETLVRKFCEDYLATDVVGIHAEEAR